VPLTWLFCRDRTFSLGAIVTRRLSLNRSRGPIFGGIYASRISRRFEIPIRHDEEEEMLLPTRYLDYNSMVAHDFIKNDKDKRLIYNVDLARILVRVLLYLHLLCSIFIQEDTSFCSRTFMHTGSGCDPLFLSQNYHLICVTSLVLVCLVPPSGVASCLLFTES